VNCPWCDAQPMSESDFALHIIRAHPEKGLPTAEVFQQLGRAQIAQSNYVAIMGAAADLTLSVGPHPSMQVALETFRFFFGELMKLSGIRRPREETP